MASLPHETRNDLSKKTRARIAELCNQVLASVIDLRMQVKQAHWNVKGPNFIGLHELFDKIAADLSDPIDETAERITALGGVALGTVRLAAKGSALSEYPHDIFAGADHVKALSSALAKCGAQVRAAIDDADEAGDKDTADLFTGLSRLLDKSLWLVEAHGQASK